MKVVLLVILVLLSCGASVGQTSKEELAALNRINAAEAIPAVTPRQCSADLASWEGRDDSDEKNKVGPTNLWIEKVSTEELIRLSTEAAACLALIRKAHRTDLSAMSDISTVESYHEDFNLVLFTRAKDVLIDHGLVHEWLLTGTNSTRP